MKITELASVYFRILKVYNGRNFRIEKMTETSLPVLNHHKKKVSEAYLYAVIAKANFAIQKFHDEYDGLGYDYSVTNRELGSKRTVFSESSEIKIQLKAVAQSSASMFEEKNDCVRYKLDSTITPIGPNCYLIVVNLLGDENIEQWIELKDDELILRKCAYYMRIPQNGFKPGFIEIPKVNKLTLATLKTLFIDDSEKNLI